MNVRILLLLLSLSTPLRSADEAPTPAELEQKALQNIRQITFDGAKNGEAYFSADGREIVFQGVREPGNPFYQIYRLHLPTAELTRISNGIGRTTCAYFHPKKQRMIYASTHLDPLSPAKQKEEIEKQKSAPARRYNWDFDPFFEIFECDPDGKNAVQLTRSEGYDAECAYSPDGSRIVFCSMRDQDPEIYVMDADGNNPKRLTNEKGYDGGPFFSPDGKQIIWRHFDDAAQKVAEIWIMDADGKNKRQVTDLKGLSWAPYFHPSMKWIVFAGNHEDPAFELYAIRPDGKDLTRLTFSNGFDGLPAISADGKNLMWTSNRTGNKSQIFIADLQLPGEAATVAVAFPAPQNTWNAEEWAKRKWQIVAAGEDRNIEHELGKQLKVAGVYPPGMNTLDKVEETYYVQGPSVAGWTPPIGKRKDIIVLSAALKNDYDSCLAIATVVDAAHATVKRKKENPAKDLAGLFCSVADPDELLRLYPAAQGAVSKFPSPEGPIGISTYLNIASLANVVNRQLVIRGIGSSAQWRGVIERLAWRHPKVHFVLEDDPATAPELEQFVSKSIPCLSIGPFEPPTLMWEPEEAKARAADRQSVVSAVADLISVLSQEPPLQFSAYDAAAVRAAASASARPYLGTIPDYKAEGVKGVKISGVRPASPAEQAGLKGGDVIVEVGGMAVKDVNDYLKALENLKPGTETTLRIERDGKAETVKVTPAAR